MKIKSVLLLFMMLFLTSCSENITTTIPKGDEWIVVGAFARWGSWDIYGVNANESEDTVLDMAYIGAYPDWSPESQWVVYSTSYKASQETSEIYLVKSDGTNKVKIAKGDKPVWSPNGNQIAYTLRNEIYLLDINCLIDGKSCNLQATFVAAGQNPDWSPDGQRMVFELNDLIYVINSDGANMREISLINDGGCREPDWSPTGNKILFWCWGDSEGFYTINSDGTDMKKIEIGDMGGVAPKWSPSGTKIAFIHYLSINSAEGVHSAVYVMNEDGSDLARFNLQRKRANIWVFLDASAYEARNLQYLLPLVLGTQASLSSAVVS